MLGPKIIKECKGCGKLKRIQNKTLCLCQECIYKKNHRGLSKAEVSAEAKERRELYEYRRETGERQFFLELWEKRPHYCENCGKWLGDEPKAIFFAHKIAKSIEQDKRLSPSNIDFLCEDCHYAKDFRGKEIYEKRKHQI